MKLIKSILIVMLLAVPVLVQTGCTSAAQYDIRGTWAVTLNYFEGLQDVFSYTFTGTSGAGVVTHTGALAFTWPGYGVTLYIEFHRQHARQVEAVLGADMALVRARVHGDPIGPGIDTHLRVLGYIRVGGIPGVAD